MIDWKVLLVLMIVPVGGFLVCIGSIWHTRYLNRNFKTKYGSFE